MTRIDLQQYNKTLQSRDPYMHTFSQSRGWSFNESVLMVSCLVKFRKEHLT